MTEQLIREGQLQYFAAELNCLLAGRDFFYLDTRGSAQEYARTH